MAEKNGVPFAVIIGEDELAQGVVKIKEMGLPEGHPRGVREHLSAYAYPRIVEFVDDLPKTLTGKIRRIELRERSKDRA